MNWLAVFFFLTLTFSTIHGVSLPLYFDSRDSNLWTMQPDWTPDNPAMYPIRTVGSSETLFAITEHHKGMKWTISVTPIRPQRFLALKYLAWRLDPREYVLWAFDTDGQGHFLLYPQHLTQDGEWHTHYIDISAFTLKPITVFALNVQAGAKTPAHVWIDSLDYVENIP